MEYIINEKEKVELISMVSKLIQVIHYITIATVDNEGNPWNSPVNTAYDENFNFYWKSPVECQHSANIRDNGKVFFVLFDSRVPVNEGIGIYFKGKAFQIEEDNIQEVQKGSNLIASRVGKLGSSATGFISDKPRRVYKAIPTEIWINTVKEVNGINMDGRVNISLELLMKFFNSK